MTGSKETLPGILRAALALLVPFLALGLQILLRELASPGPSIWFIFFPAVFVSGWIGGARFALVAALLSIGLAWWFLVPPEHTLVKDPALLVPAAVFLATGIAFAAFFDRLARAQRVAAEALAARLMAGERESAARAQRESEHRYSAIFENSPYAIAVTKMPEAVLVGVNHAFLDLFGFTREEVIGRSSSEVGISDPDSQAEVAARLKANRTVRDFECVRTTRSGARLTLALNLDWVEIAGQQHVITTIRDITATKRAQDDRLREEVQRRRVELQLGESEARYQALVDSAVDGIITIDERGAIESFNPAAEKLFGYPEKEVIGKNVSLLMPPPHREQHDHYLARYLSGGRASIIGIGRELEAMTRDGRVFPIHLAVSEVHLSGRRSFAGFVRDLTLHRELEDQVRHAQKMEAIGTLTTGVAHDFGNLLMGISGCASIALGKLDPDHPAAGYVRELSEAAKRGAGLTRQLTTFSRKQRSELAPLRLAAVVRDSEGLLRRLTGDDIEVRVVATSPDTWIVADRGQLEQVLVNLVVNARDAMRGGGTITIATAQSELDERTAEVHGLPRAGGYATLSVADDGEGMDAATRSRVFEPFFTTKPPGKGTGLGLATVYGIARQLGGTVRVQSQPGIGTTFTLYVPVATDRATVAPPGDDALPGGSESVLLIEDEELVRLTVRHQLEGLGYAVVDAREPSEALAICRDLEARFDLVLTDVVMPRIGGRELVMKIRALRPDVRVLYMSAHPTEELLARGRLTAQDDLINKPFTQADLALAVRAILDRDGRTTHAAGAEPAADEPAGARGTVLLVDDSLAAQLAIADYLEELGYRTIRASLAGEAIEAVDRDSLRIDLLLTDFSLPDMKGDELARRVQDRIPDIKVVFMSGYSRADLRLDASENFLEKPVDLDTVVEVVRTVIGR